MTFETNEPKRKSTQRSNKQEEQGMNTNLLEKRQMQIA
jgi:hypothetical protein